MSTNGVFVADGVAAEDFLETVYIQQVGKRVSQYSRAAPPHGGEEKRVVDPARNE